ncbi:c-type cytochrome biogenesis protein CcsB [Desulfoluna butyratoxydans]|uniref:Heme exporter protein C n=1 Tax=Desulfoluna butyratoxydans TaxID=231438 RepID=A0A4U8YSH0_9BACT|nr:c-type cytochrome biogenesis protein CcsB [Desulfoluna butyratoxydans]VFQ44782.1 cytochrome c-type biogenesis protein ccsa [Desulfoluna butyratoxydans]
MTSSLLISIATFVYGLSGLLYFCAWIFKSTRLNLPATATAAVGLGINTAGFLLRWSESYALGIGRIPLSNLYESLVFYGLAIAALYLVLERLMNIRIAGGFALTFSFLALAYASLSPSVGSQIRPLMPALKSNWLSAHVMTCFVGYAAFALSFALSLLFLFRPDAARSEEGSFDIDEASHQMILLGFLFLSIGIITGAVWANSAWGRYWGWDPKETWSLITWFIYASLIHVRLVRGWSGKKTAVLSIIGFAAVMFTYFGVNLLPGLHSYGA